MDEYGRMDSTAIFSISENMSFFEMGHNSREIQIPQINIMMLLSRTKTMPTSFVRILSGPV